MPELCGSTTLSANIIAIAASVALPPARNISIPASAARGSAAETVPAVTAGDLAGAAVSGRLTAAITSKARRIMRPLMRERDAESQTDRIATIAILLPGFAIGYGRAMKYRRFLFDLDDTLLDFKASEALSFTRALSMTVAVRGDYVRLPITDLLDAAYSGINSYWRPSPKIGINYRPSDEVRAYAAFNTGFRAPAALELSCADATAPCSLPFALGADPPLKPVTVLDYEAGIELDPASRTNLAMSAFLSDVRNDILFVQPTATTGFFQNVARTRRAGVDLSGAVGLPSGLRAYGSYSYVAATYRTTVQLASALGDEPPVQPGDRLPNSPAQRASAGLDFRRAISRSVLEAAIELHGVSGQYVRGDEANVRPELPGYAVTDIRLIGHLPHATLRAYVTNIFNRRYSSFGVYARNVKGPLYGPPPSDPGDAPVERFLTPGQPRLFVLSIGVEQ